jgi:cellulose synthase/poly-beta-1,6-N-acetylglucosamine synthase-like glycosyltransferase
MTTVLWVINVVVLVYFLALDLVYAALLYVSFWESGRHMRRVGFGGYDRIFRSPLTLPISIIVPAYNEEATIVETVNAMRLLEYGEFQIVVVVDGSRDETLTRLVERFSLEAVDRPVRMTIPCGTIKRVYVSRTVTNLTVIAKENGGKADALNAGINAARYPLFCAVDADAILESDALLRVVKPFMERPRETVATAGIVRVVNGCKVSGGRVVDVGAPRKGIALFQVIEYLRSFLASRTAWSRVGALFIISGAFGLFKKDAVVDVGGYRTDTVGEDLDLVLRLHRLMRERRQRYRIVFIPDPVVWTEVPESLRVLHRQRNRWHRGLLEGLMFNRDMMGRRRYGVLGLLALPYNLVFEAIGPLLECAGYVAVAITAMLGLLSVQYFVLFTLLAFAYGIFLSVSAVFLEELRMKRYRRLSDIGLLLLFTILENLGYRQTLAVWRVQATFDYMRKKSGWGEMKRKGYETV